MRSLALTCPGSPTKKPRPETRRGERTEKPAQPAPFREGDDPARGGRRPGLSTRHQARRFTVAGRRRRCTDLRSTPRYHELVTNATLLDEVPNVNRALKKGASEAADQGGRKAGSRPRAGRTSPAWPREFSRDRLAVELERTGPDQGTTGVQRGGPAVGPRCARGFNQFPSSRSVPGR